MNQALSRAAQSVQNVLINNGLECCVQELASSTRTAQDAATSIGCNVSQIVKSLIFKTALTNKPVLVLASGPNRVNEQAVEEHIGEKIVKSDADFTRDVTGFAIGGIPPIGHKQQINLIFIDEDLMKLDSVWAAAGTPNAVFNILSKDLLAITNGKIINITIVK
ncbi:MAG: YbaK/EbsC family protein [Candidatus Dependentiae bacterium]|nr:YbaK/EbsC family protein [Candidatus Dependentiae bacterium]